MWRREVLAVRSKGEKEELKTESRCARTRLLVGVRRSIHV
jgi:hypothetical protein